jgi:hypothetical protein
MTRLLAVVTKDAAGESRVAYFDCSDGAGSSRALRSFWGCVTPILLGMSLYRSAGKRYLDPIKLG